MTAHCPKCGAPLADPAIESRPFCSRVCKLADLGSWLDGGYRIPGEPVDALAEQDAQEARRPSWGPGVGEG